MRSRTTGVSSTVEATTLHRGNTQMSPRFGLPLGVQLAALLKLDVTAAPVQILVVRLRRRHF